MSKKKRKEKKRKNKRIKNCGRPLESWWPTLDDWREEERRKKDREFWGNLESKSEPMPIGPPNENIFSIGRAEVRVSRVGKDGKLDESHSIGFIDDIEIEITNPPPWWGKLRELLRELGSHLKLGLFMALSPSNWRK